MYIPNYTVILKFACKGTKYPANLQCSERHITPRTRLFISFFVSVCQFFSNFAAVYAYRALQAQFL